MSDRLDAELRHGKRRGRARFLAGLAVAATLPVMAAPAPAQAAVYCVNVANPDCTQVSADFQTALNSAEGSVEPDRVRLGPGTYSAGGNPAFAYDGSTGGPVEIIGSGQAQTTVTMPTPSDSATFDVYVVFDFDGGTGDSMSDLTVRLPGPADPADDLYRGIDGAAMTEIEDVDVTVAVPGTSIGAQAAALGAGGTVDDTRVLLPRGIGPSASNAFSLDGNVEITDTEISADTGISSTSGTLTARRLYIQAGIDAISAGGGTVNVESTVIDLGTIGSYGLNAEFNNPVATAIEINADGVTIVGDFNGAVGVRAAATGAGDTTDISVTNSVLDQSLDAAIMRVATNTGDVEVTTDYSNYDNSGNLDLVGSGGTSSLTETNRTDHVPGFVDPTAGGGNFHLLSTSPLIDIGDPMAPSAGALDFDGNPRALSMTGTCAGPVAGRRDIGADEYVPPNPAGCPPPGGSTDPAPVVPAKKKCKKKKKGKKKKGKKKRKKCRR